MTSRTYLVVGHGGQGILDLGNFIAYDAMVRGQHLAYTPSYGPETRGGKVRCYVVKSSEQIESPIMDEPDVLIAMNNPSMDFEATLRPNGLLLVNSSLVDRSPARSDLQVIKVPATELADGLKTEGFDLPDTRVLQNAVAYGSLLAVEGEPLEETCVRCTLDHVYTGTKSRFVPANFKAIECGYEYISQNR